MFYKFVNEQNLTAKLLYEEKYSLNWMPWTVYNLLQTNHLNVYTFVNEQRSKLVKRKRNCMFWNNSLFIIIFYECAHAFVQYEMKITIYVLLRPRIISNMHFNTLGISVFQFEMAF